MWNKKIAVDSLISRKGKQTKKGTGSKFQIKELSFS